MHISGFLLTNYITVALSLSLSLSFSPSRSLSPSQCHSCAGRTLSKMSFAVVVLDECSQQTMTASLVPIIRLRAARCVVVGDPKQLPPVLASGAHSPLRDTLFLRLARVMPPVVLTTQYRCHPALGSLAATLFYPKIRLTNGVTALNRSSVLPRIPLPLAMVNVRGTCCDACTFVECCTQ